MKLGRFVVNVLKWNSYRSTLKRRKLYPIYTGKYDERIDIPYIDDGDYHHKFDVFLAKENRKNCVIIDIHGGSYIFGEHKDQYAFGDYFLKEGYDFGSLTYPILLRSGRLDASFFAFDRYSLLNLSTRLISSRHNFITVESVFAELIFLTSL